MVEKYFLQGVGEDYPGLPFTLALVSDHQGEIKCLGTGVLVAPGLALTAAHVVRAWLDREPEATPNEGTVSFGVTAYQLVNGKLFSWPVVRMHAQWRSELAFLELGRPQWWGDGPGQTRTPVARLNVKPPRIGSGVRVFGFPESSVDGGLLRVTLAESHGTVRGVEMNVSHGFRPQSYVELDGESKGGMSGGPCFDDEWNVQGVISTGGESLDAPPHTTMALLWPVMSLSVDLFEQGRRPAWDVFKDGSAAAIGSELVHVTQEGQVHIANFDPSDARPAGGASTPEFLESMLTFAAENAQRAMINVGQPVSADDGTRIIQSLRLFFWELESALHLTLRLSADRLGVTLFEDEADWDVYFDRRSRTV